MKISNTVLLVAVVFLAAYLMPRKKPAYKVLQSDYNFQDVL